MKNYTLTIKYRAEKPIYPFDTVMIVKLASKSYSNVLTLLRVELARLSREGCITPKAAGETLSSTVPKCKKLSRVHASTRLA